MNNPEYTAVLAALDQARLRLEADWLVLDDGALRIRSLINLAIKASQTAVFSTVALLDTVALLKGPHAATDEGKTAAGSPAAPSS